MKGEVTRINWSRGRRPPGGEHTARRLEQPKTVRSEPRGDPARRGCTSASRLARSAPIRGAPQRQAPAFPVQGVRPGAGNVTCRPLSRRSHTAKPINVSPLSGPASPWTITSASARVPAGIPGSLRMIVTDTKSPVTLDGVDLQAHRGCQTDGVGEVRAGRRDAGERGWDARPRGACELTGYRIHTTVCIFCQ
jgi:hypothetical protein